MENYGRRIIVDLPFDVALKKATEVLRDEGIDVLSQCDVRGYFDRHLHHDFRRYVLLQAAIPRLTLDALQEDLAVGAILPITVAVYELADGETAVIVGEPFGPVLSDQGWRAAAPVLAALADEACDRLARAIGRLQQRAAQRAPATPTVFEQFT